MAELSNQIIPDFLSKAVKAALEREGQILLEEAKKELERRTPEIVTGILVDVMSMASFQTLTDRVVFTIRKMP